MLEPLIEKMRALADVRIDPHADTEPLFLEALQHPLGIGENISIPFEVAPVVALHPKTIEVKHVQGKVARRHTLDVLGDGLLVVIRGERRRQPKAKGPQGRKRWAPRKR